jgi:hypothetical protein
MAARPASIATDLQPDDPLVQNAEYRFDATDRQWVDTRQRAAEQHLADSLLNGVVATWADLDAGSAAVSAGQVVCSASAADASVTLATSGAIANAGSAAGVVLQAANPGGKVRYAIAGALPPSVTGLGASAGYARVSSAGAVEYVASLSTGDYVLGTVDTAGSLTLGVMGAGIVGAGSVTSVGASAPITSTGGATPTIGISAASGVAAGSMSAGHYTLLANATDAATASRLFLRDSNADGAVRYLTAARVIGSSGLGLYGDATGTAAAVTVLGSNVSADAATAFFVRIAGGSNLLDVTAANTYLSSATSVEIDGPMLMVNPPIHMLEQSAPAAHATAGQLYYSAADQKLHFIDSVANGSADSAISDAVTSVGVTAPITTTGGLTPTIGISAADGSNAGSMSASHYTLLANATDAATAGAIAKRDGSGRMKAADPAVSTDVATQGYVHRLGIPISGTAQTSSAAPVSAYTYAVPDKSVMEVETTLVGLENATSKVAVLYRLAYVQREGGTVTQTDIAHERSDQVDGALTGVDGGCSVSGTNLVFAAQGIAATDITWSVFATIRGVTRP